MSSTDFGKLMDLIFQQKKAIETISLEVKNNGKETVHIQFNDKTDFRSSETDVADYVTTLRQGVDEEGNVKFKPFKDLNKYFEETREFVDKDNSKLHKAVADLKQGKYKFSFDPDKLIEEFLVSKNRKSKKFLPLKTEYFHIAAHQFIQSGVILGHFNMKKKIDAKFDSNYKKIDDIFRKAFRNDPNFIKNYLKQKNTNNFDFEDFVKQINSVTSYTIALKDIFPTQGVEGEKGIGFVLDIYRRYAEGCVKPLNLLRIGKELNDGISSPKLHLSASKNKRLLLPDLGSLLDCYDPRIRNSESHISTEIDKQKSKVIITDARAGKRKILAEYTFQEIIEMTNVIRTDLFSALIITIYMVWRTMLLVIVFPSIEYKHMLLEIDNT